MDHSVAAVSEGVGVVLYRISITIMDGVEWTHHGTVDAIWTV